MTPPGQSDSGYEDLRDAVMEAFNPPDEDGAEVSIMVDAVEKAFRFIDGCPCRCSPAMVEDHEACARCDALGRLGGTVVIR